MDRTVSVTGYVEIGFDEVLRAFADEELIAELFAAATVGAFPPGAIVELQASSPVPLTRSAARVKVLWQFVDPRGRPFSGQATLQLLVLQSGHDPLTELLLTVTIDDAYSRAVATAVNRFVDGLVTRLARVSAS
jgi:hypothetical protein